MAQFGDSRFPPTTSQSRKGYGRERERARERERERKNTDRRRSSRVRKPVTAAYPATKILRFTALRLDSGSEAQTLVEF